MLALMLECSEHLLTCSKAKGLNCLVVLRKPTLEFSDFNSLVVNKKKNKNKQFSLYWDFSPSLTHTQYN